MNDVSFYTFIILGLTWCVFQLILFVKIWFMTTDVKNILVLLNAKDNRDAKLPKKAIASDFGELDVLGMENGKVKCSLSDESGTRVFLFDFEDLKFVGN